MLNLDKLNSQIDLKQLNISELTKGLAENQKFIKLLIIVLSLLSLWALFNQNHAQDTALKNKITKLESKLTVIKNADYTEKQLADFKASFPKAIGQFDLLALVSNEASRYHVTIASLQPPDKAETDLATEINFNFTAVSDDFKSMMLFLRRLETLNPPLRINSWSGQENSDGRITSNFNITCVHIHS